MESKIASKDILVKIKEAELKEMTISFIKKDGTKRIMRCMYGVKVEEGKGMRYDAEGKGLVCVFDMDKEEYRMVNLSGVKRMSIGAEEYIVEEERKNKLQRRNRNVRI